jgi:hypothetical protein
MDSAVNATFSASICRRSAVPGHICPLRRIRDGGVGRWFQVRKDSH